MAVSKEYQSKHWKNKSMQVIESYWTSPPATLRSKWFVELLKGYQFDSIFEVGFFSGRNLKYIKEAFPSVYVGGLEINPKAVKYAKGKLGINNLMCGNLHDLDMIHDDSRDTFDIVFTSGVLIHVPPKDLDSAMGAISRKASKYVMHIEQNGASILSAGPKNLKPHYKVSDQYQWNNDIIGTYRKRGYEPDVINLPDECMTNGASEIIIVKL